MNYDMTFDEKLRARCKARGLHQADLLREIEERLGPGQVSKQTVSNWFAGKNVPDIRLGCVLARILHVTLDSLADGDKDVEEVGDGENPPLTEDEWWILRTARELGINEAKERLILKGFRPPTSLRPEAPRGIPEAHGEG